jgi:hypothetical protein
MAADRAERSAPARSGLLIGAAVSVASVVAFAAFRVVDILHLIPASREAAAALALAGAGTAGGVAAAVQLLRRKAPPIRPRSIVLVLVVPSMVLLGLHVAFVFPEPDGKGDRAGSVVISWSRASCQGETVDCTGKTGADCLRGLSWDQELIDACWGEGRVLMVRLALTLCSLLVSGGFGGLAGLGALAWRSRGDTRIGPLRLFLCYRRADSGAIAERLHERLSTHFGADNVFRDVEDIGLGEIFRQPVQRAIAGCDVFLAVIGPGWLVLRDEDGARRLDRPNDPVRSEIETAIARGLRIVPVLVGGAAMPRRDQMPSGLQELSDRAGARITGDPADAGDLEFASTVDELIRGLEDDGREGSDSTGSGPKKR